MKNNNSELIIHNSKVPVLRFPEFSGEWEVKTLGDVTKINQGLQIAISERFTEKVAESYFYITNEFLKEGSKNKYFIKNPSESVLCNEDDILMTRTGNTGQVVTNVSGAFHNNFFKIKYNERLIKWFLFYFLTSYKIQCNILKLAGTSTIPDLNHSDFYKIKISFPSIPEQQKIADFLTQIDNKINQLNQKKQLLERYKKGVMQRIMNYELIINNSGLRFTDDDGREFPEWEEKKLGDIGLIITGKTPSTTDESLWNGSIQFVTPTDITEEKYQLKTQRTVSDNTNLKILPKNSIMFTCIASIGKMALSVNPCITNQQINSIIPSENYNNEYVYYSLLSITDFIKSTQANTTLPIINKTEFSKFKILVPSKPEQTKIANFLTALDEKIALVEKQLHWTKQYKKGLLQQLFV